MSLLCTLLFGSSAFADDEGLTVVVEDQRADAPDPNATSSSVTVLPIDETVSASTDLAALVESATGTTVTRLGGLGDYTSVSIRGSTARQVQVHIDGVPLNPDGIGAVNLSELPLGAFEHVEVWRGNAPASFGALPIGGVVNLVTGEQDHGRMRIDGGSLETVRLGASASAPVLPGVDALFIADAFHTDGAFEYFDDNGTVFQLFDDQHRSRLNNDTQQASFTSRLRADLGRGSIQVLETTLLREEGLPGHIQARNEAARLDTRRHLASVQLDQSLAPVQVQARARVLRRYSKYEDRTVGLDRDQHAADGALDSLGLLASAHVVRPHLVPGLTVSGRRDRYQGRDLLSDTTSARATRAHLDGALHADVVLWGERVTVTPVLAGLWLQDAQSGKTITRLEPTPRLGLLVRPHELVTLKANVGRYLRPPDFDELFGDSGAIHGNDELLPEEGLHVDVSGRVRTPTSSLGSVTLDVGHFWMVSENRIVLVQNSQRTSVPTNLGETWVQGLEAALTIDALGWVDSATTLTRTLSVNLDERDAYWQNQLPRIPLWEVSQRTSVHWDERVRLGHGWSYTDGNYWDATNWYESPPRNLHSVFLRAQPTPAWPSLEASVLNLFDRQVEVVPRNRLDPDDTGRTVQPVTDFVGYPLPGRTLLVSLSWEV
ncbi:MAG: TonB-dependent receptor [Proteobacteria bacterium]|nr:TonB-dependent receptor [Pseudomonadota bacterium]MCP4916355.1 TonB-dependent receptor [Pseudomonadota bacterium]